MNGKKYVGQTISRPQIRWSNHKIEARTGSPYAIHRAIRKHGVDNFSFEVIAECIQPFLDDLEVALIDLYASTTWANGYNMTVGGDTCGENHPGFGKKHTDEHKRKISESLRGQFVGSKNPMFGKSPSLERREKQRQAMTGRVFSPETIKRMKEAQLGAKHHFFGKSTSAEVKAKISSANKGKTRTEETKRRMRESAKLRPPRTEEHIRNLVESRKRTMQERKRLVSL